MGKKGKGRQSGGFTSKSLRANHSQEVQRIQNETLKWTRQETSEFVAWTSQRQKERLRDRPRFVTSLRRNLTGILNERRSWDSYVFRERRRRNGFLPPIHGFDQANSSSAALELSLSHSNGMLNGPVHPEGWLLHYNNNSKDEHDEQQNRDSIKNTDDDDDAKPKPVARLQDLSLVVFAHYIRDYRDVMGDGQLYGALSILPPESLTELSIILSSSATNTMVSNSATTNIANNSNNNNRKGKHTAKSRSQKSNSSSNTNGPQQPLYMDNDLASLLGQHSDVESLCFRNQTSQNGKNTLTSSGLEALIPRTPVLFRGRQRRHDSIDRRTDSKENSGDDGNDNDKEDEDEDSTESVLECWDCDDGDDENNYDYSNYGATGCYEDEVTKRGGCNLKLRRLELLDLNGDGEDDIEVDIDNNRNSGITMLSALSRWFEKCSGITHLSLAGSFSMHHEVGIAIVLSLPRLLPSLQVLDVTRCPWATDSLLARMMEGYHKHNTTDHSMASSLSSLSSSSSELLPTVYYYREIFLWQPGGLNKNRAEIDPWEDDDHNDNLR